MADMTATLEKMKMSAAAARRAAEESTRRVAEAEADLRRAEVEKTESRAKVDSVCGQLSETLQEEVRREGVDLDVLDEGRPEAEELGVFEAAQRVAGAPVDLREEHRLGSPHRRVDDPFVCAQQ